PRNWVNCGVAIWVDLEVQVGTGGKTKVAHAGNLLARGNALAYSNVEGLHVSVNRHGAIVVLDANPVAVAGSWARVDDGAVHDGQDWGAVGVRDINACVERAPAWAKSGGERTLGRAGNRWGAGSFIGCCTCLGSLDCGIELL